MIRSPPIVYELLFSVMLAAALGTLLVTAIQRRVMTLMVIACKCR